ncbi:MAG: hypothetical protein U0791_06030 [Gemmataceae bacterium]
MHLFNRFMILGAVTAVVLGFTGTASADPGKGFRWSDHAWGTAPRGQSMRTLPSYANPGPSSSAAGTVAVRGPDGVVRTYPVEGGAIVQRQTGLPTQTQSVTVRDADGVLRSYPVVTTPTTASPTRSGLLRHCR